MLEGISAVEVWLDGMLDVLVDCGKMVCDCPLIEGRSSKIHNREIDKANVSLRVFPVTNCFLMVFFIFCFLPRS